MLEGYLQSNNMDLFTHSSSLVIPKSLLVLSLLVVHPSQTLVLSTIA